MDEDGSAAFYGQYEPLNSQDRQPLQWTCLLNWWKIHTKWENNIPFWRLCVWFPYFAREPSMLYRCGFVFDFESLLTVFIVFIYLVILMPFMRQQLLTSNFVYINIFHAKYYGENRQVFLLSTCLKRSHYPQRQATKIAQSVWNKTQVRPFSRISHNGDAGP
jgi:hypothetical protein